MRESVSVTLSQAFSGNKVALMFVLFRKRVSARQQLVPAEAVINPPSQQKTRRRLSKPDQSVQHILTARRLKSEGEFSSPAFRNLEERNTFQRFEPGMERE
jgi:hypothetical protein